MTIEMLVDKSTNIDNIDVFRRKPVKSWVSFIKPFIVAKIEMRYVPKLSMIIK